jgi:hypothetical protein
MNSPSLIKVMEPSITNDVVRACELEMPVDGARGDQAVELTIGRLNRICRNATLSFTLEVGRTVIQGLYHGDLSPWRSRCRKSTSLRKLANHPALPMSPSALFRCIAIYEVCMRMGGVSQWKHLSTCHVRAVLNVPERLQQSMLLRAEDERWSVNRLEREAASLALPPARGGRRRRPRLEKTLQGLERLVDIEGRLVGSEDAIDGLEQGFAHDLLGRLAKVRRACESLEGILHALTCGSPGKESEYGQSLHRS